MKWSENTAAAIKDVSGATTELNWLDELESADGRAMRQKGTHQAERQGYKSVIKPTMTYGAEYLAVRNKDENRLHVAEMRMLRRIRGKTRNYYVRNQIIQEGA